MSDDKFEDLIEKYRIETAEKIESEAKERLSEVIDIEEETELKSKSLVRLSENINQESNMLEFTKALYARLGVVRSSLVGHGGGMIVLDVEMTTDQSELDLTLTLDGACIACGAAPATLVGIRKDLEDDKEINGIKFSKDLLESFGDLGKEFLLTQTNLVFV